MSLMTVCEVCTTPKAWTQEEERYLLVSDFLICPLCKQMNTVSFELKLDIQKHFQVPEDCD